jgi:hypothetical protein
VIVCIVVVLWIARRNERFGWRSSRMHSVFRQTGDQLEQGNGDTMMIQINTLSMAVFSMIVNSAALLSISM